MAEVAVNINGKSYNLACDPGQEQRILDLSQYIDERSRALSGSGIADNQLMLLTSLVLADELFETKEQLNGANQNENENETADADNGVSEEETLALAEAINQMALRIEGLSARLSKA